jgi:hypothetical protein
MNLILADIALADATVAEPAAAAVAVAVAVAIRR